jgi:hypothetical protein
VSSAHDPAANGAGPANPTQVNGNGQAEWARLQRLALLVAGVGIALYAALGLTQLGQAGDPGRKAGGAQQFFLSWLTAWVFWLSLPIGSLALLGIQAITAASWGVLLRRFFESATRTLPLMILLFLPLAASLYVKDACPYPWVHSAESLEGGSETAVEELKAKFEDFNNTPGFLVRSVVYFVIWALFVYFWNAWSARDERTNDPGARRLMENMAGPMVCAFALLSMFASTDFVMSLELHWASTMFPVIYGVNQMLTAFCFAVAVFLTLSTLPPLRGVLRPKFQVDMGTFMLALTMVWSYTSFSQYLLIWVGNLPEEIPFFLKRTRGGWDYAATALCLFHFALPFLLLLFRDIKLHPKRLRAVAIGLLVICALDVLWWIEPVYAHDTPLFFAMDVGAIVGMGGIWGWLFLNQLKKYPLLPTHYLASLPREHGHDY